MYRWLLRSTAVEYSSKVSTRCLTHIPRARCTIGTLNENKFLLPTVCYQRRFQSSTDKKFHCGVCKKAFRLEMAAKLHLQQAHGGDGAVEAGPGPGVEGGAADALHSPTPTPPPPSPITLERNFTDDEERRPRRMRPTPKPLHNPDREVPEAAMQDLLGVWDKIGLNRLEGKFIHSTMVMKVFAARPDAPEQPLYEPLTPEGENPFENLDQSTAVNVVKNSYVGDEVFTDVDLKEPFVTAPNQTLNPFRAGKVENPFTKSNTTQREVPKLQQQQQQQQKEDPVTAPVTPFGQLPLFGKEQEIKEPIVTKAVKQGTSDLGEVSSPFSSSVVDSPFIGKISSPFNSTSETATTPFEASPFTATSPFTTPGLQQSSPFTSSDTPSPFAQSGSVPISPFTTTTGISNFPLNTQQEQRIPDPEYECTTCGKKFSTFEGSAMHSKAKHGIILEPEKKGKDRKRGRGVPDLPAYIPSPVDLSSTSPFGTKTAVGASWAETELIPHAQCISNITIVGRVLDVTQTIDSASQITVFVQGERNGEEETVTLHCSGDINAQIGKSLKRNATVFVSGTLRLHPIYESSNNKYYVSPVVHVALPTGTLAVIT